MNVDDAKLAARFWSKVDIRGPDECWPWKASRTKRMGYGKFGRARPEHGWIEAHRVAYELGKAPIAPGAKIRAGKTRAEVARGEGVSWTTIDRILRGKAWAHLNLVTPVERAVMSSRLDG